MIVPANAFELSIRVDRDEVDLQGHASNVAVVRWISRAAWAHSRALGFDEQAYRQLGAWFVVRRHEVDYHGYARPGDELIAYTWPSALRKVVAERRHVIERVSDRVPIAEAINVWAYVSIDSGRPVRIPPAVRQAFDPARFA
jgi:acyl-CoA thioester hydrolase